jgi:hypothetical protein
MVGRPDAVSLSTMMPHKGGVRIMEQFNNLRAVLDAYGGNLKDLTVLAPQNDPFRVDTPAGHRDGEWLANMLTKLGRITEQHHLRGLHYILVSAEDHQNHRKVRGLWPRCGHGTTWCDVTGTFAVRQLTYCRWPHHWG